MTYLAASHSSMQCDIIRKRIMHDPDSATGTGNRFFWHIPLPVNPRKPITRISLKADRIFTAYIDGKKLTISNNPVDIPDVPLMNLYITSVADHSTGLSSPRITAICTDSGDILAQDLGADVNAWTRLSSSHHVTRENLKKRKLFITGKHAENKSVKFFEGRAVTGLRAAGSAGANSYTANNSEPVDLVEWENQWVIDLTDVENPILMPNDGHTTATDRVWTFSRWEDVLEFEVPEELSSIFDWWRMLKNLAQFAYELYTNIKNFFKWAAKKISDFLVAAFQWLSKAISVAIKTCLQFFVDFLCLLLPIDKVISNTLVASALVRQFLKLVINASENLGPEIVKKTGSQVMSDLREFVQSYTPPESTLDNQLSQAMGRSFTKELKIINELSNISSIASNAMTMTINPALALVEYELKWSQDATQALKNSLSLDDKKHGEISKLLTELEELLTDAEGIVNAPLPSLYRIIFDLLAIALDVCEDIAIALLKFIGAAFGSFLTSITAEISVPVIDEDYTKKAGRPLSVLDAYMFMQATQATTIIEVAYPKTKMLPLNVAREFEERYPLPFHFNSTSLRKRPAQIPDDVLLVLRILGGVMYFSAYMLEDGADMGICYLTNTEERLRPTNIREADCCTKKNLIPAAYLYCLTIITSPWSEKIVKRQVLEKADRYMMAILVTMIAGTITTTIPAFSELDPEEEGYRDLAIQSAKVWLTVSTLIGTTAFVLGILATNSFSSANNKDADYNWASITEVLTTPWIFIGKALLLSDSLSVYEYTFRLNLFGHSGAAIATLFGGVLNEENNTPPENEL